MRSTLLPAIFLFTHALSAQNLFIDSLRQNLDQAKEDTAIINYSIDLAIELTGINEDSAQMLCRRAYDLIPGLEKPEEKVMALQKVGVGYNEIQQPDTAFILLEQARKMAEEMGFKKGLAFTLSGLGILYKTKREREKALDLLQQSADLHKENNNWGEQAKTFNNMGLIYNDLGDYAKAISFFEQALLLQERLDNKFYLATIHKGFGISEMRRDSFHQAIDHYKQALELSKKIGNTALETDVLDLFGHVYRLQGDYNRALSFNQQAFSINKALGNKKLAMLNLMDLGHTYSLMGDYPKSVDYSKKALYLAEVLGDEDQQAGMLNNIGDNIGQQGNYHEALDYLYRSLKLGRKVWPERLLSLPLCNLGIVYEKTDQLDSADLYLKEALAISNKYSDTYVKVFCLLYLGRSSRKQGNISQAIIFLEEGYSLSEDAYLSEKKDIAEQLYLIYKEQNNLSKALLNHERFKALQDTLFNEENTREFTRLELEYNFEQEKHQLEDEQEKEALIFNARLQRQRYIQIATASALGIALVIVLIITRYYRLKRKANEELTQLNAKITDQKEQLQQLNQVKSHFFTNISHEFRTPLTVIRGMTQQIRKSPDQWAKKGSKVIERNTDNLLNLVNQILELRKLETGSLGLNLVQGDIIFYLRYITESFQSLAEHKDIILHFLNDEMEIMMDYDKEKILRIVSNLLSNAIKFSPEGSNVYLIVSFTPSGSSAPTGLEIKIRDNGIGIGESQLPYIFGQFYKAGLVNGGAPDDDQGYRSMQSEGTGIGLPLTKALVELMKGTIKVESVLGKGTIFSVFLPISNTAPIENPVEEVHEERPEIFDSNIPDTAPLVNLSEETLPGDDNKPSLLLIEDNPDVVEYLDHLLRDQYLVKVARDGEEGIETALDKIPDLILTDVMMPKKDGFEVCTTLKADDRTSHIPIVFLTAKADLESRIVGLERGADAYMSKPFHEQELKITLEKLLDLRKTLQERYGTLDQIGSSKDVAIQQEDAFITKLRDKIESNLPNDEFGIPELCKAMGMSRSQLHLKIKALTNKSTSHFIRMIRLQKAKELLRQSGLSITEVAFDVGFQDPSYFTRTFTEAFGVSPSEFSKN